MIPYILVNLSDVFQALVTSYFPVSSNDALVTIDLFSRCIWMMLSWPLMVSSDALQALVTTDS